MDKKEWEGALAIGGIVIGVITILATILIALYQINNDSLLIKSELVSSKVSEINTTLNYVRIKSNDLQILCSKKIRDNEAIKKIFFDHQSASDKLISEMTLFYELGRKPFKELECYADFHNGFINLVGSNNYCVEISSYQPKVCFELLSKYKNTCYNEYIINHKMDIWGRCIDSLLKEFIKSEYHLSASAKNHAQKSIV